MNPSPFHATPVKDGRRILGEKSANACLSPAGNRTVDLTPVKRTSLFESNSSPKKLLPSPEFMSRKRPIAQVDGIPSNYESSPVQRVSAMPHGTTTSTQSTIADDSQPIDARQDTQSTQEHHAQRRSNTPRHGLNAIPEDPEPRKVFIQEKATLLRTRIQSAMLHIRDHEFDRRLSALEAHSRKHPRLSSCALSQRQAIQPLLTSTTQTRTPPAVTDKPDPETTNGSGLSSPPLSTDNTNQDHMKTPTQNDHCPSRPAASPVQLSSPPVSVRGTGHAAGADDAEDGTATEKVSTPSQQGDAVDGLLKLMKTGER